MTITAITTIETIWMFCYSYLRDSNKITKYQRYMLENFTNLLWDVPIILIMVYYHHLSFKIKVNCSSTVSNQERVSAPIIKEEAQNISRPLNDENPHERLLAATPKSSK